MPETTVIIRTKDEERWLGAVLEKLFQQTYKDFEIIIVDSGSTDRTLDTAKRFSLRVLPIPRHDFSYPRALNHGIARSAVSQFIVVLSAHSLPISETWLASGLEHLKGNFRVAGVYGFVRALPDATLADRIFQNIPFSIRRLWYGDAPQSIVRTGLGVLGFTNAIIRKDLWQQRPFNEEYGAGGEDGEWAGYWLSKGYTIMRDPRFTVMHSHYLGLWGWYRQLKYWKSSARPHPFAPLRFRRDRTHES
ncbi:MAG: glycosyltransferase family A protein [bacterium]|nr:glycosyltransferase family A protein [bacterium]MDZ4296114.1 glycosyltransferase family A protein [Patescibacteria group bacterium]